MSLLALVLLGGAVFFVLWVFGTPSPQGLVPLEYIDDGLFVFIGLAALGLVLVLVLLRGRKRRRGRGQRRPGVDYLWDKVVEAPPVPGDLPDWVRQLAPPEVERDL
jgi:hypothetical protein